MGRFGFCATLCVLLNCASGDAPSIDPVQPTFAVGARPALMGGTLVTAPVGERAYVSFPDLDSVARADFWAGTLDLLALGAGAQPGRLVLDRHLMLHVIERGTGDVADVDVSGQQLKLVRTRHACAEPRGLAADGDLLYVACAGGDLVTFNTSGGEEVGRRFIERDLRDVVVVNGNVRVSTFRSAELIGVDEGTRVSPPTLVVPASEVTPVGARTFTPGIAWRTIGFSDGSTVTTFQRGLVEPVGPVVPASISATCQTTAGSAYGGTTTTTTSCPLPVSNCDETITTIAHSGVMVVAPNGTVRSHLFAGALPVDVAVSPIDGSIVVAMAGSSIVSKVGTQIDDSELFSGGAQPSACSTTGSLLQPLLRSEPDLVLGVGFLPSGDLVVQTETAVIRKLPNGTIMSLDLSPQEVSIAQRDEAGYRLFHREATPGGVACATCHPEALEDGRTWALPEGLRRTQSLGGGAMNVAPFHWDGSLPNVDALMSEIFVKRMGGAPPQQREMGELEHWLGSRAAPKSDAPSSAAGKALFEGRAGCSTCHLGPRLTNGALADVGTGGYFKVPSLLGVGARFPLMHTGCAKTFAERFDPACGGARHGTFGLSTAEVSDLSAYLSSL